MLYRVTARDTEYKDGEELFYCEKKFFSNKSSVSAFIIRHSSKHHPGKVGDKRNRNYEILRCNQAENEGAFRSVFGECDRTLCDTHSLPPGRLYLCDD